MKIDNIIIIRVGIFTALTIAGSYIRLPLPNVPVTLQTLIVLMSGNLLGARFGALSQLIYLSIGLVGVPVFAYGGGLGYVFQPTFGYLLSFPFCAMIVGLIIKFLLPDLKLNNYSNYQIFISVLLADFMGVFVIFSFGLVYIYLNLKYSLYLNVEQFISTAGFNWENIIKTTLIIFIPIDLVKATLASFLTVKLKKFV